MTYTSKYYEKAALAALESDDVQRAQVYATLAQVAQMREPVQHKKWLPDRLSPPESTYRPRVRGA